MGKLRVVFVIALLSAVFVIALPIWDVKAAETLIFSADVPSTGGSVFSPLLQAGRQYRIEAYGAWWSSGLPFWYTADAQYYTTTTWDPGNYQQPDGHSFLQINEMDVVWGMWSDTPYYHTYSIYRIGTGALIAFRIVDWIDGNYANNECRIHVYIYEGPALPPIGQTAYAYGGGYAKCFLSLGFNNWGWTNGPLGAGFYDFDLYAGAAKCDITRGTLVGTVTINYDGSTATVTYLLDAGWAMDYTQVYAGSEMLPRDLKGKFTTSPGMYTSIHYSEGGATTDTHIITGLSGSIWVIAHADVFET